MLRYCKGLEERFDNKYATVKAHEVTDQLKALLAEHYTPANSEYIALNEEICKMQPFTEAVAAIMMHLKGKAEADIVLTAEEQAIREIVEGCLGIEIVKASKLIVPGS